MSCGGRVRERGERSNSPRVEQRERETHERQRQTGGGRDQLLFDLIRLICLSVQFKMEGVQNHQISGTRGFKRSFQQYHANSCRTSLCACGKQHSLETTNAMADYFKTDKRPVILYDGVCNMWVLVPLLQLQARPRSSGSTAVTAHMRRAWPAGAMRA